MYSSYLKMLFEILLPKHKTQAFWLIFILFIGVFLEALGVGIIIPTVAVITQKDIYAAYPWAHPFLSWLGNPPHDQLVVGVMVLLSAIYAIKIAFLAFVIKVETAFSYTLQGDLSNRLFANYLYRPYTFHLQRNSAELIRNVVGEINVLVTSVIAPGLKVLSEAMVIAALSVILVVLEPIGALSALVILGSASWLFYSLTKKKLAKLGLERQIHEGQTVLHMQQGMSGVKDAKVLGRENGLINRFRLHNDERIRVGQAQTTLRQYPRLWIEFLAVLGFSFLVLGMVWQGKDMSTIAPVLGVFAAAAFRLMPSLNRILSSVQSIRYGFLVIKTIHSEFTSFVPKSDNIMVVSAPLQNKIEIKNITYNYPAVEKATLKDVTFTIAKGESVGIIGSSGSGKSTLIDVLMGLLPPQKGQVLADGKDVYENLRKWQTQIGYVAQTIYLTDDSLRRNIAFGISDEQIDETAIWNAIKSAQLDVFIKSLPEGLDTFVGERGVRLSGGQRQRIGIARALYHNPDILVLDEATSSLDTPTEDEVMKSVYELGHSKTIVIVAHRLSTVAKCNRIIRMSNGQVESQGTPTEMLPTNNNNQVTMRE